MREILFRGYSENEGCWVFGDYAPATSIFQDNIFPQMQDGYIEGVAVTPETVGQYTGITDKNGTKIFEGDIIKNADGIYVVEYCKYLTRFAIVRDGLISGRTVNSGIVIGNIYDNPELLK